MKQTEKRLENSPATAGGLFTVTELIYLSLGLVFSLAFAFVQKDGQGSYPGWYIYLSYLVAPLSFGLVLLIGFRFSEISAKEVYAPSQWRYYLLALLLQFGLFSLAELNDWFLSFLGGFGYAGGVAVPSMENGGLVWSILVIALLPAFFEESIFRGLLLCPLKKTFTPFAVLLCGGLFAIYHQSPAQTVYQFFCGCAYALMAIRAGSVLPTMLAHFLNNAFILILYYFGIEDLPIVFYLLSAAALIGSVVLLVLDRKKEKKRSESEKILPFFRFDCLRSGKNIGALPGIFLCLCGWIANFIIGVVG